MLELLQSNRMSLLVETLTARLQQPNDPFEPTLVVVQSQGIGQWLKVELANHLGIAANIDCLLPAELIWRLYQSVLPNFLGTELPSESPFSTSSLSWRLMQHLPEMDEPSIQNYLNGAGDPQLRLYQLSHAIALLFDQYLIYRPDWIYDWEAGKSDPNLPWQSKLWQTVVSEPGIDARLHRASLHQAFLKALQQPQPTLPQQLNVLGISSLPGMHLETLQAVAKHAQVSVYFLNPSRHYWGDIESEKTVAKKSIRHLIGKQGPLLPEDYLEVGNPLLSSTGQQGREFIELLLEAEDIQSVDLFQDIAPENALQQIQADLLDLEYGGAYYEVTAPAPKLELKPNDKSVQIHSTHSRMREVEVLSDQLLAMMANQAITPSDIIVMAPDISQYAPFIQSVFQNKIPFSITDRPVVDESALLVAAQKLLALPDSRLSATEVMDLLDVPGIARKFELSDADLGILHYWIRESGIRFEKDGKNKQANWQLPAEDYNTWRFGLDRLLLGYAMEPEVGLFDGTAPLEVSPADAQLLGTLCDLLDLLVLHREALNQEQSPQQWQNTVNQMLSDLIAPTLEEEFILGHISDGLDVLVKQSHRAEFDGTLSPRLFRYWLQQQLDQPAQNRGFVSGGVTFATLVPMRSIPYECVCLLGMNDREFPREDQPLSFDLMSQQYRKGDRSRRSDDRYLFLESIMSAQQVLYLSYVGRGQRDNKAKPPSELLSEVQEYLNRLYDEFPVTHHPLQPYDQRYFVAGSELVSYANQWRDAFTEEKLSPPFSAAPIPPGIIEPITHLDELARFYRHPAKFFLNRLGVYFSEDAEQLRDTESFALSSLERYQLADEALQTILHGDSLDDWIALTRASGLMLPGRLGQKQLQEQIQLGQEVASVVEQLNQATAINHHFELQLKHQKIQCEVSLRDGCYVAPRTGKLRARQVLEAWIHHLALCASGIDRPATLVYRDKNRRVKHHQISPVAQQQATDELCALLTKMEAGLTQPLAFLPEASLMAAQDQTKNDLAKWYLAELDNDVAGSEAKDPYHNRLHALPEQFDDDFYALAKEIWQPYLAHEVDN